MGMQVFASFLNTGKREHMGLRWKLLGSERFSDAQMANIKGGRKISFFLGIKQMRSRGDVKDQSLDFLSQLETRRITTCGVNTGRAVVYGLSRALKVGSGFSKLSAIPLTTLHVAKAGERLPPSSGGYSLSFLFMRYDPPPLDLVRIINGHDMTCMLVGPPVMSIPALGWFLVYRAPLNLGVVSLS